VKGVFMEEGPRRVGGRANSYEKKKNYGKASLKVVLGSEKEKKKGSPFVRRKDSRKACQRNRSRD